MGSICRERNLSKLFLNKFPEMAYKVFFLGMKDKVEAGIFTALLLSILLRLDSVGGGRGHRVPLPIRIMLPCRDPKL